MKIGISSMVTIVEMRNDENKTIESPDHGKSLIRIPSFFKSPIATSAPMLVPKISINTSYPKNAFDCFFISRALKNKNPNVMKSTLSIIISQISIRSNLKILRGTAKKCFFRELK
jgi:hypothetical protein